MAVIDHLVYAVADLNAGIDWFEQQTGIRPAMGGAHVGLGTHNALVSFGECYLEIIAPDPGQPDPEMPRPFGIDDLDDPGLVGFAVRPADDETIEDLVDRCFDTGYDPGPINDMSRQAPNGDLLAWVLTFPSSPTLPFIIDWGDTPLPSTTQPGGVELESFAVHHPLPFSVMGPLAALGLDIVVVAASRAALTATITGPGGSAEL
ncbi:MAG: VOC family protein [Actinomycetota bacterium]|nr:VOC family protein [Actinomycetota bacterium]